MHEPHADIQPRLVCLPRKDFAPLKFAQLDSMPSDLARLTIIFCVLLAIESVTAGQSDSVYDDIASSLPWMQRIRRCACRLCMQLLTSLAAALNEHPVCAQRFAQNP